MNESMQIEAFFDETTSTISYIVVDPRSMRCAVIDPVLDYDQRTGKASTKSADAILEAAEEDGLTIDWILETHVHADHLSAAPYIQAQLGGRLAIGSHITTVQQVFGKLFNAGTDFARDGSQFNQLLDDGETFAIGTLQCRAMHTPGHTPACMTYVVSDGDDTVAFVGDTLFMPDYGTARCDFPGGDARTLYRSIRKVLSLPPETRLYLCHDYQPGGRDMAYVTTVAEQRAGNIHVHDGVSEDEFATMRADRDATLEMPTLMLPSVQVNMRAGELPPAESNGMRYIKIPLNAL